MADGGDGLQVGREVASAAGDRLMGALGGAVDRLRAGRPEDGGEPPRDAPSGLVRLLPAQAAADLVAAIVAEIVPAVLERIDADAVLDRVNVQRLVDRIDVQALLDRVDMDAVVDRIDVDALVDRLDVDAVVRRIDLAAATREALEAVDIGEIVRESTATVGSDLVEGVRVQAMRADAILARAVDALLRRRGPRRTEVAPPEAA
jgi:hypothetical protein